MKITFIIPLRLPALLATAFIGSVFLMNSARANESTLHSSAGSFSAILAQSSGGILKRFAEKRRQKKAERQSAKNQNQQSTQPSGQNQQNNQYQWNWIQGQNQNPSQTNQQTQQGSQNQWNWIQQGQNQNQSQTNQQAQQNNQNQFQTNQQAQQTSAVSNGLTVAERNSLVNFHNQVRREVGVGQVRWSSQIANYAQQWADEIARTGNFRHRQPNQYGENLAQGTAGSFTVLNLAEMWYNEKRLYTPGRPFSNSDMRAGHYTQMVWRGSTQIGAGKAIIKTGRYRGNVVLVCNYAPAGNMLGQLPY